MKSLTSVAAILAMGSKVVSAIEGKATYYNQYGVAGSCGEYRDDSEFLVALGYAWGHNNHCGSNARITNNNNDKTIYARVIDTCLGYAEGNIDLSVGAAHELNNGDLDNPFYVTWDFA